MLSRGDRVLIFSQWTTILNIMETFLDILGFAYFRIDGSTPVTERQPLIDAFNKAGCAVNIFLLSTRAGGMGINLTSANVVVMHDIDFNPQNDMQATARCHRIGQMNEVKVYRLLTRNTYVAISLFLSSLYLTPTYTHTHTHHRYEAKMFEVASRKLGIERAVRGYALLFSLIYITL